VRCSGSNSIHSSPRDKEGRGGGGERERALLGARGQEKKGKRSSRLEFTSGVGWDDRTGKGKKKEGEKVAQRRCRQRIQKKGEGTKETD